MKAALLAITLALSAPYQCGTEKNVRPVEDSAPEALWKLAERFREQGDLEARATTLKQLLEQYPSSRYAERAREELGDAPPPSSPSIRDD